jgi:hypothetical protein
MGFNLKRHHNLISLNTVVLFLIIVIFIQKIWEGKIEDRDKNWAAIP